MGKPVPISYPLFSLSSRAIFWRLPISLEIGRLAVHKWGTNTRIKDRLIRAFVRNSWTACFRSFVYSFSIR